MLKILEKINQFFRRSIEKNDKYIKKKENNDYIFSKELEEWSDNNYILFKENYYYYNNNCCPYCGVVFENEIKRTRKCPSCKQKIIRRVNLIANKKLLLTEKRSCEFDKDNEKKNNILFFEKKMKSLQNMYPDYMYYFWDLKKKKTDLSVRDYTWSFTNWLFNELDSKIYNDYRNNLKLKFQDRIIKCDWNCMEFIHTSNVYRFMIDIAVYMGYDDVVEEMIFSLIYRSATIAYLPYYHWKDRTFSEITFYSDASFGMNYIEDYLKKYDMKFEDLKDLFFQRAHPFIINILNKEKAWAILCEAYKRYIYVLNNNEFKRS